MVAIKNLKVKFVDITGYKGKQVALVFIGYRLGREKHVYDTMFMCENLPKKEYAKYSFIPLTDLDVKCAENGHPYKIWFKEGL